MKNSLSRPRVRRAGTARLSTLLILFSAATLSAPGAETDRSRPNVLMITVDTLRADRLSSYGYGRPSSPNLDRLLDGGARFALARVVEPLTNPSLCSVLTSLYPHEHGATRNGLRMRAGLESLPKTLREHGYRTAAFVGNWTLRDKLSGLAEHFDVYEEVLTRRRWFGFLRSEATAEDLTELAAEWMEDHAGRPSRQPFLLWVHYVEPHAPYRFQNEYADRLGLPAEKKPPPSDRYDTEVAFVDASIGDLLRALDGLSLTGKTLVVFASDHGESLGEHGYWGHGRHLYEPTLWIPMGLSWPGRLRPQVVDAPALSIDLAPTVLRLLELPVPGGFSGFDWSAVLRGAKPPKNRVARFQAHRGAVISKHESDRARRSGLLAVALIEGDRKEIYRMENERRQLYDLKTDPAESRNLAEARSEPSETVRTWVRDVYSNLATLDEESPELLDEESIARLRALGYVD